MKLSKLHRKILINVFILISSMLTGCGTQTNEEGL